MQKIDVMSDRWHHEGKEARIWFGCLKSAIGNLSFSGIQGDAYKMYPLEISCEKALRELNILPSELAAAMDEVDE